MASLAARATQVKMLRRMSCFSTSIASRVLSTRATSYTLNTGAKIPALGFGTFQDHDSQEDTVSLALQKGMRLIDTARVYDVEEQVGRGVKKSGIPRENIFIGTKLWCNDYHPDDVERAVDDSLRDLDTPYVDLLLMHYPCTFKRGPDRFPRDLDGRMVAGETTFLHTWKAMEKVTKTGKVKAIGVSNFSRGEINILINESSTVCTPSNHNCRGYQRNFNKF
jgi:diketogulonate reductase-like aldo/keto reductase